MKKLIFINGTMGSGKTATSRELAALLDADWLDGDWCWIPQALCLTEEKKELALQNISLLLRYELRHGVHDTLIFCWVMHQQKIIDELLARLVGEEFKPYFFTLLPDVETLTARLQRDVDAGLREQVIIGRAINHLPGFSSERTIKIDNSRLTPRETAELIREMICQEPGANEAGRAEVALKRAEREDIPEIHRIQLAAFKELLEKYRDYDTSPGAEPLEYLMQRFEDGRTDFYLILLDGESIGALMVCPFGNAAVLNRICVLPGYRGRGFARRAIALAEGLYPQAVRWELDTVLQEAGLCRFYESLGYAPTGEREHIKDGLDIVYYAKGGAE